MAFNLEFYKTKKQKLTQKNQQLLQDYIDVGIKFGRDINDLGVEIREVEQMILENTPKAEEPKVAPVKEAPKVEPKSKK